MADYIDRYIPQSYLFGALGVPIDGACGKCHQTRTDCMCQSLSRMDICGIIEDAPSADVVPWEWLKRYSSGMFMNYASDWVDYAEKVYKEKMNG